MKQFLLLPLLCLPMASFTQLYYLDYNIQDSVWERWARAGNVKEITIGATENLQVIEKYRVIKLDSNFKIVESKTFLSLKGYSIKKYEYDTQGRVIHFSWCTCTTAGDSCFCSVDSTVYNDNGGFREYNNSTGIKIGYWLQAEQVSPQDTLFSQSQDAGDGWMDRTISYSVGNGITITKIFTTYPSISKRSMKYQRKHPETITPYLMSFNAYWQKKDSSGSLVESGTFDLSDYKPAIIEAARKHRIKPDFYQYMWDSNRVRCFTKLEGMSQELSSALNPVLSILTSELVPGKWITNTRLQYGPNGIVKHTMTAPFFDGRSIEYLYNDAGQLTEIKENFSNQYSFPNLTLQWRNNLPGNGQLRQDWVWFSYTNW
jgi:hypothetical protein